MVRLRDGQTSLPIIVFFDNSWTGISGSHLINQMSFYRALCWEISYFATEIFDFIEVYHGC